MSMRSTHAGLVAPLLVALLPALPHADDSLRCPRGIVSVGDLKVDLLGKCGEPTLRELSRAEESGFVRKDPATTGGAGQPATITTRRETSPIERWTYDFGPSQFIRVVTLDGGRVRSVATGGRGYSAETTPARRPLPVATCDYKGIRVGDEGYEVLARCGEPATRDVRLLERALEQRDGDETVQRSVTISIEVWVYHFGPQTFTRIVELEDGKVVKVETGSHGYPPP